MKAASATVLILTPIAILAVGLLIAFLIGKWIEMKEREDLAEEERQKLADAQAAIRP